MPEDEEFAPGRLSRRDVLKRAGVAGAVVWTAPMLSSVTSAAHARVGSAVECPGGCDPNSPCGAGQPVCAPGCGCIPEVGSNTCFCHQGTSCAAAQTCTATSDCPAGLICAGSCCAGLKCLPPCGTHIDAGAAADGLKSTG